MTWPVYPWPPTNVQTVPGRDILCEDLLLVAPTVEPLDLEEVKKQRRFSITSLDTRFDKWISAARQQFEQQTGLQLITATRVFLMERFPLQSVIRFWRAPVQSVSDVSYLDDSGTLQMMSASDYEVYPPYVSKDTVHPGGIQLVANASWPTSLDRPGAVRITYQAGFGNVPADVPELIRDYALMQYIGDFHRFTEQYTDGEVFELPMGVSQTIRLTSWHMMRPERMTRW